MMEILLIVPAILFWNLANNWHKDYKKLESTEKDTKVIIYLGYGFSILCFIGFLSFFY